MTCCKYGIGIATVCALALAVGGAMGLGQPEKKADKAPAAAQPGDMKMDPQMEACMKLGMPGEEHKGLAKMAGTWDAEVKMFEPGKTEAQTSHGTMVNTLVHDGRFIQHDFKGDFMGMQFAGGGLCGYNNASKKYESTWTDNMSTGIMFSTGTFDAANKTFTFNSDGMGPDKTGKTVKMTVRETIKILSDDKHVMTMFATLPGEKEEKCMEITYTRAAADKGAKHN